MRVVCSLLLCTAAAMVASVTDVPAQAPDPLGFLAPTVSISTDDRRRLDAGEPILRTLDGGPEELVIFGAAKLSADGDRLVAWIRRIEDLKRSERVPAIGRFSAVPTLDDLTALSLSGSELADLRACRPAKCALKLDADEITDVVRSQMPRPGGDLAVQRAFRRIVLGRAQAYLAGDSPVIPALAPMLDRTTFLRAVAPAIGPFLTRFPHGASAGIESFLYWSVEDLGARPVVSTTHVAIVRPPGAEAPEVIVAGRQFFATHYVDHALNLTMVTRPAANGTRYLVFVNRSHVDVLGGILGGVKRWAVERKLRADGRDLLAGLRARMERGLPVGK